MKKKDETLLKSFDCMACGTCLWRDDEPQTEFACIVLTRSRAIPVNADVEISEYAQVCSRECFDVVRSTWERHKTLPKHHVLEVQGELINIMWDLRPFTIPSKVP